jgi:N-acetylglucosamine-6-phosphate deacetylase
MVSDLVLLQVLLLTATSAVSVMDPHLKDGVYPWRKDGHSITKSGDAIKLTGTDTLAGAAVPLDSCVRNLAKFCEIPLSRAIHCATRNPATAIGGWVEATKGALKVGYDADLTVWDPVTRQITATWIAGHVYNDRNARE